MSSRTQAVVSGQLSTGMMNDEMKQLNWRKDTSCCVVSTQTWVYRGVLMCQPHTSMDGRTRYCCVTRCGMRVTRIRYTLLDRRLTRWKSNRRACDLFANYADDVSNKTTCMSTSKPNKTNQWRSKPEDTCDKEPNLVSWLSENSDLKVFEKKFWREFWNPN